MRDLEKYLRFILFENDVAFQVAPYSAQGQVCKATVVFNPGADIRLARIYCTACA